MISENKKKHAYWLEPSLDEAMGYMLPEANATSKSEFVRLAIKFYMAFLRQGKSLEFLSPLLTQAIKSEIEGVEQRVSGMLFKVAVEQSKVSFLLADQYENADGKRIAKNIYAPTREECEEKLAELIIQMKAEIAEEKARQKNEQKPT